MLPTTTNHAHAMTVQLLVSVGSFILNKRKFNCGLTPADRQGKLRY